VAFAAAGITLGLAWPLAVVAAVIEAVSALLSGMLGRAAVAAVAGERAGLALHLGVLSSFPGLIAPGLPAGALPGGVPKLPAGRAGACDVSQTD